MNRKLFAALLAAPIVAIVPASAASSSSANATEAKIQALQQQLESLQKELTDLKAAQSDAAAAAAKQGEEIKNRIADTEKAQKTAVKASLAGGRPTISTADGKFTASLRGQLQADYGYYMQSRAATKLSTGTDLSSGVNIRRAQLGLQGKVFGDWSYNFLYDFGGSGTESAGKILNAYVQYDGLAPFAVRFGAFAPSYSVEDQTASGDLMFLERNTPTNMLRNVAGAEGRVGASLIYAGNELFGAVSYTASKIMDSTAYDEQQAVVGRLSYLVINDKDSDAHLLVGVNGVHVFRMPDAYPNGSTSVPNHTIALSDYPEITVDDTATKFLSTGALAAEHFTTYGVELAGNYRNFYVQGAYSGIEIDRGNRYTVFSGAGASATQKLAVKNNDLYAWYAQASWVLTGESKAYVPATGAFTIPKPAKPFSLEDGTWGAFELAGRFSETSLNDRLDDASSIVSAWSGSSRTYTFYNQSRGGYQKVYTLGLNWYPNSAVRFLLDYMWVDENRYAATSSTANPSTVNIGQGFQAVALRSQIAF